jgi:poly-beta-1,6-N-acetyl-D-glucosamine synthase
MLELVFWAAAAFVVYVYVGYPALLMVWAKLRPLPPARRGDASAPPISIILAARNEAATLPARLDNLLRVRYDGLRQIIVVSDGSTDNTLDVLKPYRAVVDVVAVPAGGKALALNAGVAAAAHDVLVFADARQTFDTDALVELTAPLADPSVGAVSGELVLDCEHAERRAASRRRITAMALNADRRAVADRRQLHVSTIGEGIGLYWKYEKALRRLESATGSTLGATGAIYAMRRELWRQLPPGTILDDVLVPMRCVMAGWRVVFNDRARACDRAAEDAAAEARRKSRTLAGNWQILGLEPALLLPWRNPVWLQYVSHKVGRLLVPFMLITLLVVNTMVAGRSLVYAAALAAQGVLYLLAAYGAWLDAKDQRVKRQHRKRPGALELTHA